MPANMEGRTSSHSSSSSSRRHRITLACAYCRYRKIRCDGGSPCKNCRGGDWACEYVKVSAEENKAARERKLASKAIKKGSVTNDLLPPKRKLPSPYAPRRRQKPTRKALMRGSPEASDATTSSSLQSSDQQPGVSRLSVPPPLAYSSATSPSDDSCSQESYSRSQSPQVNEQTDNASIVNTSSASKTDSSWPLTPVSPEFSSFDLPIVPPTVPSVLGPYSMYGTSYDTCEHQMAYADVPNPPPLEVSYPQQQPFPPQPVQTQPTPACSATELSPYGYSAPLPNVIYTPQPSPTSLYSDPLQHPGVAYLVSAPLPMAESPYPLTSASSLFPEPSIRGLVAEVSESPGSSSPSSSSSFSPSPPPSSTLLDSSPSPQGSDTLLGPAPMMGRPVTAGSLDQALCPEFPPSPASDCGFGMMPFSYGLEEPEAPGSVDDAWETLPTENDLDALANGADF